MINVVGLKLAPSWALSMPIENLRTLIWVRLYGGFMKGSNKKYWGTFFSDGAIRLSLCKSHSNMVIFYWQLIAMYFFPMFSQFFVSRKHTFSYFVLATLWEEWNFWWEKSKLNFGMFINMRRPLPQKIAPWYVAGLNGWKWRFSYYYLEGSYLYRIYWLLLLHPCRNVFFSLASSSFKKLASLVDVCHPSKKAAASRSLKKNNAKNPSQIGLLRSLFF